MIITYITSSALPTVNTDNFTGVVITAQAAAITSFTTNLSGTPNDRDPLYIAITDDGSGPYAINMGSKFSGSGTVSLPTTTADGLTITMFFLWDDVKNQYILMAVDPVGY